MSNLNVPRALTVFHDPSGFDRVTLFSVTIPESTASLDRDSKVVYEDVTVFFDVVFNSYAYGEQLQVVARTQSEPYKSPRTDNHNGHNYRMEPFYLDVAEVPNLIWALARQWQKYEELRKPIIQSSGPRQIDAKTSIVSLVE